MLHQSWLGRLAHQRCPGLALLAPHRIPTICLPGSSLGLAAGNWLGK
uniref:Uncharacterized protein n=1 Tax=Arundo donax TaxID=35708 RepID=A0A0A9HBX4_ARUDO